MNIYHWTRTSSFVTHFVFLSSLSQMFAMSVTNVVYVGGVRSDTKGAVSNRVVMSALC